MSIRILRLARNPWTIVIGGVVALLVFIGICRVRMAQRLENRLQQIRAAGLPASGSEIAKWRPKPLPSKNGARAITEAYYRLQSFTSIRKRLELSKVLETNWWEPENLLLLRRYVETNQNVVVKLHAALEFPEFAYVNDYAPGFSIPLPHLAKLKESAYLLSAKAALEIEAGSEAAFVRDVQAILRLAETLDSEPILVSWLVRNAIIQIAVDSTWRALNRRSIPNDMCVQLENDFARVVATNLLPNALIGERALALPIFQSNASQILAIVDSSSPVEGFGFKLMAGLGIFEWDGVNYIELMDEAISVASQSPPASLALTNRINYSELERRNTRMLAKMFVSNYENVTLKDARFRANVAMARSALAVEMFRLEQGTLPEMILDLVPKYLAAPLPDPYGSEPIRYRKKDRGYVVYSVDEDGADDGGIAKPKNSRGAPQASFDLIFDVNR